MIIDLKKKDLADLCMFISEGIKTVYGIDIYWRDIMKFSDDFIQDNKGSTQ